MALLRSTVFAVLLTVSLTIKQAEATASSSDWRYKTEGAEDDGPEKWYIKNPDCGGVMQSPINIDTKKAVYDPNLLPFDLSDFGITDGVEMHLENVDGHTAEVVLFGANLFLKGGNLPDKYPLVQFHFHWGGNSSRGSEHSLDGKFYPLEAHFVTRQNRFPNISTAASHPFGLAVFTILFKVGSKNEKYDQFIKFFDQIPNADDKVEIPTFPIKDLLPSPPFDYYRYQGSLTTPPCYESVLWTISATIIEISLEQLKRFRVLHDDQNKQLIDDFRPIQPLNQRTVLTTKKPQD